MRKKTNINFIIDALMFISITAIAGIGFLIKYTLVPGYKENAIYGRNVDLSLWGMDRHEWGKIHLFISLLFLFLILLHIILHWDMIVSIFKKMIPAKSRRILIAPLFIIISGILMIFSFIIQPDILTSATGSGNMYGKTDLTHQEITTPDNAVDIENTQNPVTPHEVITASGEVKSQTEHVHSDVYTVKGFMSLSEVSLQYNVPISHILQQLNISTDISADINLGQLRRRYGFTMSEVEEIIQSYNESMW